VRLTFSDETNESFVIVSVFDTAIPAQDHDRPTIGSKMAAILQFKKTDDCPPPKLILLLSVYLPACSTDG